MTEGLIDNRKKRYNTILAHILLWGVILILPYFFTDTNTFFQWQHFTRSLPSTIGFLVVFYVNYFVLADKYLFKGKNKEFILYNILLILAVSVLIHYGYEIYKLIDPDAYPRRRRRRTPSPWLFLIRNSTSLLMIMGLSVAMKTGNRWMKIENERKELEKAKSEAELQNLKNQINPHFLLNTLNNIYALVEFDPPKAQTAIMELSKLLRHLLYENQQTFVPLSQEVSFIQNYIELMRLRLAENVKVTTKMGVSESSATMISPLIFISLIENAFKHGVSGEKPSFIDISLIELPDGKVEFISKNSCFPKSDSDKSGSGIGLMLVKKRLELLYPGKYLWNTNVENNVYTTVLIIDTKNESNDT